MRKIYFVRHSIRDLTNQEDQTAPLTQKGQQLADQLKYFFAEKQIQHIYSSPYLRTLQTIRPTAELLGLDILTEHDLRERAVGTWVEHFNEFAKQQWQDFDYHLAGGESLRQVQQRMLTCYQAILKQNSGNLIIGGHGTALAILFHELTAGAFDFAAFQQMTMPDIFLAEYTRDTCTAFQKINFEKNRLDL